MLTSKISEIIDTASGTADGEYQLPPNVLLVTAPDDTGRLFDLDGSFHSVDAVGAQMLRHALREGRAATAAALAQQFGVDTTRILEDYQRFFDGLQARRLIHRRGAAPASPPGRRAAPLLRPLFAVTCHLPLSQQAWVLLALARVSTRIFGWNATLRTWLRYPKSTFPVRGTEAEVIAEAVRRVAARHLFGVSCKERSLCCFALCRAAGVPASVVFGISLFPLASHCWCETAETTETTETTGTTETTMGCLTDFPDRCGGYTPVQRYG